MVRRYTPIDELMPTIAVVLRLFVATSRASRATISAESFFPPACSASAFCLSSLSLSAAAIGTTAIIAAKNKISRNPFMVITG